MTEAARSRRHRHLDPRRPRPRTTASPVSSARSPPPRSRAPRTPSDWTIADTASHLGSQAEIFGLFLDAGLAGGPAPGGDAFGADLGPLERPAPDRAGRARASPRTRRSSSRVERPPAEQRERFALAAFGRSSTWPGCWRSASASWPCTPGTSPSPSTPRPRWRPTRSRCSSTGCPRPRAGPGRAVDGQAPVVLVTTARRGRSCSTSPTPVSLRPGEPDDAGPGAAAGAAGRGPGPPGLRPPRPRPHAGRRRRPAARPPCARRSPASDDPSQPVDGSAGVARRAGAGPDDEARARRGPCGPAASGSSTRSTARSTASRASASTSWRTVVRRAQRVRASGLSS